MTKQQVINHIATRLNELILANTNPGIVLELSLILRDITREDDYSYQSQPRDLIRPSSQGQGSVDISPGQTFTYNTPLSVSNSSGLVASSGF